MFFDYTVTKVRIGGHTANAFPLKKEKTALKNILLILEAESALE